MLHFKNGGLIMKYYKVKPEFDNKKIYKEVNKRKEYAGFYIGNELYTEKEAEKLRLNQAFLEPIEVSKKKIYWCFGARFAAE